MDAKNGEKVQPLKKALLINVLYAFFVLCVLSFGLILKILKQVERAATASR